MSFWLWIGMELSSKNHLDSCFWPDNLIYFRYPMILKKTWWAIYHLPWGALLVICLIIFNYHAYLILIMIKSNHPTVLNNHCYCHYHWYIMPMFVGKPFSDGLFPSLSSCKCSQSCGLTASAVLNEKFRPPWWYTPKHLKKTLLNGMCINLLRLPKNSIATNKNKSNQDNILYELPSCRIIVKRGHHQPTGQLLIFWEWQTSRPLPGTWVSPFWYGSVASGPSNMDVFEHVVCPRKCTFHWESDDKALDGMWFSLHFLEEPHIIILLVIYTVYIYIHIPIISDFPLLCIYIYTYCIYTYVYLSILVGHWLNPYI